MKKNTNFIHHPLFKFLSFPLLLSVLFLPFKGLNAAIILFLLLLTAVFFVNALATPFKKIIQTVKGRRQAVNLTASQVKFARYFMFILLLALPFFVRDYMLDVLILAGIYAILALGLNVIIGFTGLLNLGYAAFYAIGAYSYALLSVRLGLGFWQALPVSMVAAALAGYALSVPSLRLKGDYLAIVTLGFGEIVRLVLNNWDSLTGGPNGISGIAPPYLSGLSLGGLDKYYYLTFVSVIVTYVVIKRIRISRIGRAWIAIREDETGASAMGINTTLYKRYAFAFGSLWAGLAGALFAAKMQFVSPESFSFTESVLIASMVILGGLGSLPGVVIGAAALVILPELLREAQSYRMILLGVGLIVMMIFRPQGLFGGRRA